jgi:hypothetical protein
MSDIFSFLPPPLKSLFYLLFSGNKNARKNNLALAALQFFFVGSLRLVSQYLFLVLTWSADSGSEGFLQPVSAKQCGPAQG